MSDYCPLEVIVEILVRLPVKSIMKCCCVCKSWNSLIRSPIFISAHLNRRQLESSGEKKNDLILLRLCSVSRENVQFFQELYSLHWDNEAFNLYLKIPYPFNGYFTIFRVIGSCNGLLCLANNNFPERFSIFVLWNPSIRKFLPLPRPTPLEIDDVAVGFGFDSYSGDYKVVRIVHANNLETAKPEVELFSLSTGIWKNLSSIAPTCGIWGRSQAMVRGSVHWISSMRMNQGLHQSVVLRLDMSREAFTEIMLPTSLADKNPSQMSISTYHNKSLAVFYQDSHFPCPYEVWVMKEYSVEDSWTKVMTIGSQQLELFIEVPKPLGFRMNGEVVMELYSGKLVARHPDSGKLRYLGVQGQPGFSFVDSYQESLVLLNTGNSATYRERKEELTCYTFIRHICGWEEMLSLLHSLREMLVNAVLLRNTQ